ncbi:MAG: hypothetical protein K2N35_17540 [Muribaculaceae bacterium]|nr:hypothetical protein [Muribaculaceae bacterium]
MDKIIIHIRPVVWTEGEIYGLRIRVSGENPEVRIDWGDSCVKSFYGNEIEEYHTYPKKEFLQFKVEVAVISGEVEFIDPCGGECDIDVIDFSDAPSIKEISVENCQNMILDNPNLEKLSVRIFNGSNFDLSKCPNMRQLSFEGGINMTEIDLSGCRRLERLDVDGSWQNPKFSKIVIANDAPLKYVRLSSVNLSRGNVQYIQNLITKNKGEVYYA